MKLGVNFFAGSVEEERRLDYLMRSFRFLLVPAVLMAAASGFAQEEKQKGTLWLGTTLSYEFGLSPAASQTIGVGVGAYVQRTTFSSGGTSDKYMFGFVAEGLHHFAPKQQGFGIGARVGIGGVTYIAPEAMYTTRSDKIAFRTGVIFPLGKDVAPFGLELAIGFRL